MEDRTCCSQCQLTGLSRYLVGATSGIPYIPPGVIGELTEQAIKFAYGGLPVDALLTVESEMLLIETRSYILQSLFMRNSEVAFNIPKKEIISVSAPPSFMGYSLTLSIIPGITIKTQHSEFKVYPKKSVKKVLSAIKTMSPSANLM